MLVYVKCICSRYAGKFANQTTSLRVGVELDIPRSQCINDSLMFFVALLQLLLQALGTGPGLFPFTALRTSFGVWVVFATHLAAIVKTTWAFPGSQLVSIARQFYCTLVNFNTMFRFALCIVARLTSFALGICATWSFALKTSEIAS